MYHARKSIKFHLIIQMILEARNVLSKFSLLNVDDVIYCSCEQGQGHECSTQVNDDI